jgi:type VI secretion system protein ImpA
VNPVLEELLVPIEPGRPCGPDLPDKLGPLMSSVEAAIAEAVSPKGAEVLTWDKLGTECENYLKESKHVQVAVWLSVVQMQRSGFGGLAEGLQFVHALLDRYWDSVYPVKQDPRRLRLADMGKSAGNLSDRLRFADLALGQSVLPAGAIRVTLRQALAASGIAQAPGDTEGPNLDQIRAAAAGAPAEEMAAVLTAIAKCRALFGTIDTLFEDRWTVAASPKLAACRLNEYLGKLPEILAVATPAAVGAAADPVPGTSKDQPVSGDWRLAVRAASESDVRLLLTKAAEWFEANDRGSVTPEFVRVAIYFLGRSHADIRSLLSEDVYGKLRDLGNK